MIFYFASLCVAAFGDVPCRVTSRYVHIAAVNVVVALSLFLCPSISITQAISRSLYLPSDADFPQKHKPNFSFSEYARNICAWFSGKSSFLYRFSQMYATVCNIQCNDVTRQLFQSIHNHLESYIIAQNGNIKLSVSFIRSFGGCPIILSVRIYTPRETERERERERNVNL